MLGAYKKQFQTFAITARQSRLYHLPQRPRRLRKTPNIRAMVQETKLSPSNFIMPLFIIEGAGQPQPIDSMPGQFRWPIKNLVDECLKLRDLNISGVALFPNIDPSLKNVTGTPIALDPSNLVVRAVKEIKSKVPELSVITDIALDPYTSHGHDGIFTKDGKDIDNDGTIDILKEMAVVNASAGVDFVAPSDMMDGRIGAIREALDEAGFTSTGIISYSVKFASAFYGPFRDAVGSAKAAGTHLLDKRTYQMNPANRREAMIEIELDEEEGADVLMVKPAGPYLDIIREVRDSTCLPVSAYQVSGEYSQLIAASKAGWLDLEKTSYESLLAIKRAGADMIFTYFAKDVAKKLLEKKPTDF